MIVPTNRHWFSAIVIDLWYLNRYIMAPGLPWWLSSKESTSQCRRDGFNPCIRKIPLRRKWQPTPLFLPGKSHVQRSLADCSPRGRKELDTARLVTKYQPQHDLYAAFLLGDRQRYRGKQITQHTQWRSHLWISSLGTLILVEELVGGEKEKHRLCWQILGCIWAPLPACCVDSKLLHLSVPQFAHFDYSLGPGESQG